MNWAIIVPHFMKQYIKALTRVAAMYCLYVLHELYIKPFSQERFFVANVSSALVAMWQYFSPSDVEYWTLKNIFVPSVPPPALLAMCSVIVVVWMSLLAYLCGYQPIYLYICILCYILGGFLFLSVRWWERRLSTYAR